MPTLQATGPLGTAKFAIAWPCAGIESFLIFTAVVLVFLQQMQISWKAKAGYFIVGASRHILHKCYENSHHLQHRHAVRRKLKPSANVPLLLRSTLRDSMDCFLSIDHSCKPRFMAKNKKWKISANHEPLRNLNQHR